MKVTAEFNDITIEDETIEYIIKQELTIAIRNEVKKVVKSKAEQIHKGIVKKAEKLLEEIK